MKCFNYKRLHDVTKRKKEENENKNKIKVGKRPLLKTVGAVARKQTAR